MRSIHQIRRIPYSADIVNRVVLDVEKYPEFLPWCNSANIISKEENYFIAEVEIVFKGFAQKYKSRIIPIKEKDIYSINVEAISGPFKYLTNVWKIKSIDCGSEIDFYINFQFKSKILDMVMGSMFSIAMKKIMNAFEIRIREHSK